jgi:hypothetical protein
VRGRAGRGFIFSQDSGSGGVLGDADVKRARFGHQGAILHEMVFGSASMACATATVLGIAAAASSSGAAGFSIVGKDISRLDAP